jgi:hypothetical protein
MEPLKIEVPIRMLESNMWQQLLGRILRSQTQRTRTNYRRSPSISRGYRGPRTYSRSRSSGYLGIILWILGLIFQSRSRRRPMNDLDQSQL